MSYNVYIILFKILEIKIVRKSKSCRDFFFNQIQLLQAPLPLLSSSQLSDN